MAGGSFYCFFEVGGYAGFCDVGADAGLCGVAGEVEGFEVGDDEDLGIGSVAADEFGGGKAVHSRHGDVEKDYVGLQLGGFGYGVLTVFCFAADRPVRVKLQQQFQAGSYGEAVVCNQDADWWQGLARSVGAVRCYRYFISVMRECTSGVPLSTCGRKRAQRRTEILLPPPPLRDQYDGERAGEGPAVRRRLCFGEGHLLGYTSRPVVAFERLMGGAKRVR